MSEDELDAALRALAHPVRRRILRLTWDGERTAGEVAAQFGLSRPAISQHIQCLERSRLLEARPEGTKRMLTANQERIEEMRRFMDELWSSGLRRLKAAVEAAR